MAMLCVISLTMGTHPGGAAARAAVYLGGGATLASEPLTHTTLRADSTGCTIDDAPTLDERSPATEQEFVAPCEAISREEGHESNDCVIDEADDSPYGLAAKAARVATNAARRAAVAASKANEAARALRVDETPQPASAGETAAQQLEAGRGRGQALGGRGQVLGGTGLLYRGGKSGHAVELLAVMSSFSPIAFAVAATAVGALSLTVSLVAALRLLLQPGTVAAAAVVAVSTSTSALLPQLPNLS